MIKYVLRGWLVLVNDMQAVDATDDSEEASQTHVKNPSQASLATSTSGMLLHFRLPSKY